MLFRNWVLTTEATLAGLHGSAVAAFPHTRKRQHAVGGVTIQEVSYTPYLGVRTLFAKASAQEQYNTIILFKGVNYHENGDAKIVVDGQEYLFDKLSAAGNEVVVRCNCPDFHWRFNYYDHRERALYGNRRRKYEGSGGPPANPLELPGMCKHLMRMVTTLGEADILEV